MIAIGAVALASLATMSYSRKQKAMVKRNLEGNKNTADNDRTKLMFSPARAWKDNLKLGNWPWGRPAQKGPSGTRPWWKKPTPLGSGWVDWSHEGNQFLRGPEFREAYVNQWRRAWTTELQQATRTQLVPGFWHETITKGRVLTQTNKADGTYNPDGVNLYRYQG